jgi:hypothetical protein
MELQTPTLADAKTLIARLSRSDRAALRPWLLAAFDLQGQDRRPPEHNRDEPHSRR